MRTCRAGTSRSPGASSWATRASTRKKIPYNHDGVAPGLLPSLGYKRGPWNAQLNILGFAGLMVTVGYDIARW